jgi:DNA replication licensing factor MCM4
LTRYISYAREFVHPSITEAAGKMLATCYQEMRQKGMSRKTISATPRQLESLIRLS